MNNWFMPTANSPLLQWLGFLLFLLLVCVCMGAVVVWLQVGRKHHGKRKRRRRHRRQSNPTLAQTGGLPPRRDPNVPPQGP
jgi:hypothetical protein